MFAAIARFELRYQLCQPVFWGVTIAFLLLTFASVAVDQIQLGSGGNVLRNAPYAIIETHLTFTLFFIFVTTAFVANTVVRDDDSGFGPIVRATPVGKRDYVFGRFAGAFGVAALCLLSIPVAMLVGSWMPWVDAQSIGPTRFDHYAFAYFVFALPDAWFTATLFFAVATLTRSMMWTYVSVVGIVMLYSATSVLLGQQELQATLALADPFGFAAFKYVTHYWTASERNTLLPSLTGVLLWNRALIVGLGCLLLYAAYSLFSVEVRAAKVKPSGNGVGADESFVPATRRTHGLLPGPREGGWAAAAQLLARTRFELTQVFRSPTFVVLLLLGVLSTVGNLWFGDSGNRGSDTYLVTRKVIELLKPAFSYVAVIIAIYYAGEAVWRDRERRMHEIIDATPAPDWTFVLPKALGIALGLFAVLGVSVLTGMLVQLLKGYSNFELGKYLGWYVVPSGIDWALTAVLAVFMQAISPNKFVGWGLMVLYLIFTLVAGSLGLDHNLYIYGGSPEVPLSDMNGTGDFARAAAWFRAYWGAFAVILLVFAHALWRRGAQTALMPRLRELPRRLAGFAGVIALAALAVFVSVGSYIFINTNVWNEYRNAPGDDRYAADYERELMRFSTVPQPVMTDVVLKLDLDPHAPRLVTQGQYVLENRTGAPLAHVHVSWDRDLTMRQLTVEGARLERTFGRLNYSIYRFDRPLAPGERRTLRFLSERGQRGFKNSGNTTLLVDNGTFITNREFAPLIGPSEFSLLNDRAKRRKYGLPPERRMPKLDDESARARNYMGVDIVNADITLTTVADQTPIAPGYKVSDVTRDGRRTAHFVSDAPIMSFFSVQSADYVVKSEHYKGVELSVYYDRQHPWNVDRMLAALRTGLDYFQASFGPYQFRQARILEFPAYNEYAQAFANTMPYSEGVGFIQNSNDPDRIDYVTFLTAHELAHQWWGHQVAPANSQGATVLLETLAEYSALMVMEKTYGPDKIRQFLKYTLDRYLNGRGKEAVEEVPLMRVENQPYIHYSKGSLVMYLLRDRLGEDAVNRALRKLVEQYAFKGAPYPTSRELIALLRAEAGPEHQALITDLFERITLYDLRCSGVEVKARADGRFDVAITIDARKLYANGQGEETQAPMDESFDVGLFTAEPGRGNFDRADVVLLERRPVRSGTQTITFTVDRLPAFVGVDPYNKWIDRNSNDNIVRVGR